MYVSQVHRSQSLLLTPKGVSDMHVRELLKSKTSTRAC